MDPNQIRACVIEGLRFLLSDTNSTEIEITDRMKPIPDLGMISPDGVDFACEISARIGFKIPDDVNPFLNDEGNRALRLNEIVNLIYSLQPAAVEVANA